MYRVLTINPGSTSTKLGRLTMKKTQSSCETLHHGSEELKPFKRIADQYALRRDTVLNALRRCRHYHRFVRRNRRQGRYPAPRQ